LTKCNMAKTCPSRVLIDSRLLLFVSIRVCQPITIGIALQIM
jgi:hypothetical protein